MMQHLRNIAHLLSREGGRCLLVGGAVVDSLVGRDIKDFDIEVYGMPLEKLHRVLRNHGLSPDVVGKAFGIIKVQIEGVDVDLSVPRRDNKIGIGHRGFECHLDPWMTPKEAARRRDLTINSMAQDILTGEIIDPFGGREDLARGILRATDPTTFSEDPLRVLRVMQLLPRKGKSVDPSTMDLCRDLVDEFTSLPKERVFEEFVKLLMKPSEPSVGLEFLRKSNWIKHFQELEALVGCHQNPEHHPEGDVWVHTLMVVDAAAQLRDQVPEDWRLAFMFGALLHDVGKAVTTDPVALTAFGHDREGVSLAGSFMRRLTNDKNLIRQVLALVGNHMRPGALHRADAGISAWKRLHNDIRLDVIGLLSRADSLSRFHAGKAILLEEHGPSELCKEYFTEFGVKRIPAALMGRHLIAAGVRPGPAMGQMIADAYEIQISEGIDDATLLLDRVLVRDS